MKYILDDDYLNELQKDTLKRFLKRSANGAKCLNLIMRKDGLECMFEFDFIKYLQPETTFVSLQGALRSASNGFAGGPSGESANR